jgi:hypothetical protein
MNVYLHRILAAASCTCAAAIFAATAQADPLPGRDLLKFNQLPMIATPIVNSQGLVQIYQGHDEISTIYATSNAAQPPQDYQGRFMADDFGDKLSSPVLHVRWWGSYHIDLINPNMPVNKFLIAFESDVPKSTANAFSQPGSVLKFDVVNRAPVISGPGSGEFTEKLIRGPDPLLNESLYEYNAELHLNNSFFEQKDTVYWLKIAAMVDVPAGITFNPIAPPANFTQWGWHNRDYTINDPLASNNVVPGPGEALDGTIGTSPIWHYQDDAITGNMRFLPFAPTPILFQDPTTFAPQNYLGGADGPASVPGQIGIDFHSKDLAFQLFTNNVPEPAACVLMTLGLAGAFATRRRSQSAREGS